MEAKTLQQAFDTMLAIMRAQGWVRSTWVTDTGGAVCAYRGDGGLKCAVGALLDDEAAKECDGSGVSGLTAEDSRIVPYLERGGWPASYRARTLYRKAQVIHDRTRLNKITPYLTLQQAAADKERSFRELAAEYGLDYAPPA